jgi:hypothetical protein
MNNDPIVASVRRVREQLAAQFEYDVHAIFSDMRSRESQVGARLVRHAKTPKSGSRDGCPSRPHTT